MLRTVTKMDILPRELHRLIIARIADFHTWILARHICRDWYEFIKSIEYAKLPSFAQKVVHKDEYNTYTKNILPNGLEHGVTMVSGNKYIRTHFIYYDKGIKLKACNYRSTDIAVSETFYTENYKITIQNSDPDLNSVIRIYKGNCVMSIYFMDHYIEIHIFNWKHSWVDGVKINSRHKIFTIIIIL